MCLTPFKIRSVNPVSPKLQFVPCGKCEDCRKSQKNSWSMRLSLELEVAQKNGWKVGFCTLTYSDEHLPHFSVDALDKDCCGYFSKDGYLPSCFDKKQVRDFVVNIRRDLDSDFNVHGLKYMICSEYGSNTQRPHYHCIFAWPERVYDDDSRLVGGCSDVDFFELIKKYWKFGFVFPKDISGGRDSHGYLHQPFIVAGTARFAGAYAGKYCCKDIDFVKSLDGFKFDRKSKAFRNGDCFHIQSKSLGLSYLAGKSDEQLRDLLFKGVGFAGDKRLHQLPLYLRNKIFFNPLYIVERKVFQGVRLVTDNNINNYSDLYLETIGFRVEYKRLVRRECTAFFHKHRNEIYERKVKFWSDTFKNLIDSDYIKSNKDFSRWNDGFFDSVRLAKELDNLRSGISFDDMARYTVSRFGVPYQYQYDIDDIDIWSFRYNLCSVPDEFKNFVLISVDEFDFMNNLVCYYLSVLGLAFSSKSELEERAERVRDLFKHME